jgi:mRNA interferase RelE/StbE
LTTEHVFWKVTFNKKANKEFDKLDRPIQKKMTSYISNQLICNENPRQFGHALKGKLREFWRFRVGDYRLICYIEDSKKIIKIMHVGHRKDIYEIDFIDFPAFE